MLERLTHRFSFGHREAAGSTAPPVCLELDIVGNGRKLLRTAVLSVVLVCVKLELT